MERIGTGIPDLDTILNGGFRPGSSVVFYGPPGDGKSYILWKTANAASTTGKNVVYFSLHHIKKDKIQKMQNLSKNGFTLVDSLDFWTNQNGNATSITKYVNQNDIVLIDSLSDFEQKTDKTLTDYFGKIQYYTKEKNLATIMSLTHHPSHPYPAFLDKVDYLIELTEDITHGGSKLKRRLFVRKTPRHMHETRHTYTIQNNELIINPNNTETV